MSGLPRPAAAGSLHHSIQGRRDKFRPDPPNKLEKALASSIALVGQTFLSAWRRQASS